MSHRLRGDTHIDHHIWSGLSGYPAHCTNPAKVTLFRFCKRKVWEFPAVLVNDLVLEAFNGVDLLNGDALLLEPNSFRRI